MKSFRYKEIDSTQNEAKRLIQEGEREFFVIAETQDSGRGTQGRKWISAPGSGLYFSLGICLNKNLYTDSDLTNDCKKITEKSVVALRELLLEDTQLEGLSDLYIKPINDLYYDSKKLAGILVEHILHKEESFLIIGIGLNLNKISSDESFSPISLEEICGSDLEFDKEKFSSLLAAKLVTSLDCKDF